MPLKDIYGIGKANAQVIDLRGFNQTVADERAFNRKRNAEKQAKRATMSAALNSQFDKLKNTAWKEDQQYISDLKEETGVWMQDKYAKHGEMSLLDNPKLKKEFQERIAFIVRENDASHANIAMGNKVLTRKMESLDDLDEDSVAKFNGWLDLSPQERLRTPMPVISDRRMSSEEIMEEDFKLEIDKLSQAYDYTGSQKDDGSYTQYSGKKTNQEKRNDLISGITNNPNSRINKALVREVASEINEDLTPPEIDKDGEIISNPAYVELVKEKVRERASEQIDRLSPSDVKKSNTKFFKQKEEEITLPTETEELTGEEKVNVSEEVLIASDGYDEARRNINTGEPIVKLTKEITVGEDVYPVGTWINKIKEVVSDLSNYKVIKKITKAPVTRKVRIEGIESNTINRPKMIVNGKIKETGETSAIAGAKIISYEEADVNIVNGKIIREGQKGFDKNNTETLKIGVFSNKKGNNEVIITPTIEKQYKKDLEAIKKESKADDYSGRKEGETWSDNTYMYKVVNGEVKRKKK